MKKWFIPLLALWLYGCYAGPGEEAIQHQVTAKLQSDTDDNLFEISDFAILGKEERMEGVYLIKVSYQLHFKLGLDQLQVLHDEDLVYDRVGPFTWRASWWRRRSRGRAGVSICLAACPT